MKTVDLRLPMGAIAGGIAIMVGAYGWAVAISSGQSLFAPTAVAVVGFGTSLVGFVWGCVRLKNAKD